MSLKIRAIKSVIKAGSRNFGFEFQFSSTGLNVIRAENTSGKSTVFNSIIYALGLEVILGASKHTPLTYIVTDRVPIENGQQLKIEESFVLLEIENQNGQIATVKRGIATKENKNLVTVFHGAGVTDKNTSPKGMSQFYVRLPGSAKNEKGFYNWLSDFIGWSLPFVPRYSGGPTSLFIECIVPLMFIEQKKGWAQLQATVPTQYGIKDVKQKAVEFVLKLDSEKISKKKYDLTTQISDVRNSWNSNAHRVHALMKEIGGFAENLPAEPKINFSNDVQPILKIRDTESWISLHEKITSLEKEISSLDQLSQQTSGQIQSQERERLARAEKELFDLDVVLRRYLSQQNENLTEKQLLEKRIEILNHDIRQLNDTYTISRMGGAVKEISDLHTCPVCDSNLDGSVLSQSVKRYVMDVESNINFLKDELKTIEIMKDHADKKIDTTEIFLADFRKKLDLKRNEIRSLKESVIQDSRLPSAASITEKIRLDLKLKRMKEIETEISVIFDNLNEISEEYSNLKNNLDNLPDKFSDSDQDKLNLLTESLKDNLKFLGFRSFEPQLLEISRDTLQPVVEEFDWYFESSGSDNIRAIWAYTLALLSVANAFNINHLGLLMFDEPRQHSLKEDSLRAFFSKAVNVAEAKHQIIVTTSEQIDTLNKCLSNLPAKKFIFEDGKKLINEVR